MGRDVSQTLLLIVKKILHDFTMVFNPIIKVFVLFSIQLSQHIFLLLNTIDLCVRNIFLFVRVVFSIPLPILRYTYAQVKDSYGSFYMILKLFLRMTMSIIRSVNDLLTFIFKIVKESGLSAYWNVKLVSTVCIYKFCSAILCLLKTIVYIVMKSFQLIGLFSR